MGSRPSISDSSIVLATVGLLTSLLVLQVAGVAKFVRDVAPWERVFVCEVADYSDLCGTR